MKLKLGKSGLVDSYTNVKVNEIFDCMLIVNFVSSLSFERLWYNEVHKLKTNILPNGHILN